MVKRVTTKVYKYLFDSIMSDRTGIRFNTVDKIEGLMVNSILLKRNGDSDHIFDTFLRYCQEEGYNKSGRLRKLMKEDLLKAGQLPRNSVIALSPGLATVFVSGSLLTSRSCSARMLGL